MRVNEKEFREVGGTKHKMRTTVRMTNRVGGDNMIALENGIGLIVALARERSDPELALHLLCCWHVVH